MGEEDRRSRRRSRRTKERKITSSSIKGFASEKKGERKKILELILRMAGRRENLAAIGYRKRNGVDKEMEAKGYQKNFSFASLQTKDVSDFDPCPTRISRTIWYFSKSTNRPMWKEFRPKDRWRNHTNTDTIQSVRIGDFFASSRRQ